MVTVPPESPKPRESQVRTLKPAFRSAAVPACAALDGPSGFRSRLPPQPWVMRIVGARLPSFAG